VIAKVAIIMEINPNHRIIAHILISIKLELLIRELNSVFSSQYSLQQALTIHFLHGSFMKGIINIAASIEQRRLEVMLYPFIEDMSFTFTLQGSLYI